MILLVVGLLLFIGIHSLRIFADDWRTRFIQTRGEGLYKGVYSVVSLLGFVLLIYGYGQTRIDPVFIWHPPVAMYHIASLLMLIAFVFLAAYKVPNNRIKIAVKHPMVLAVKVWALAHLLANGRLGDIVLFGAFLVWAVLDFSAARKRDRAQDMQTAPTSTMTGNLITVVVGIALWLVFAMWAHAWLIGVSPFGI